MTFDWRECLELALFLQAERSSFAQFGEVAALRCAVSRAYQGAFCCTRNYARDRLGFVPVKRAEDHERVREHLTSHRMTRIAMSLDILRQWRNDCDYYDDGSDYSTMCSSAITRAQKIFDELT